MAQGIVPRVRSVSVMAVVAMALLPLVATALTSPSGSWLGKMKTPEGEEFEVTLKLDGQGESWTGTLQDEFMGEMPLQNLKVTATRINFTFRPTNSPYPAHFSGSYIAAQDRITGTFSMRGSSRFVKFDRAPSDVMGAQAVEAEPEEPARIRHPYKLALTARASWWPALHVVKDDNYNINNLTEAAFNFDGTLRWFPDDGFNLFARYYRGGLGFTSDQSRLDRYSDIGLNQDSYLRLDGFEIGLMVYLGPVMMRNSKFNPYLTAGVGQVDWEVTSSGRGSETIVLDRQPLAGSDMAFMFGIGTEYELSSRLCLEFEWAWRYFMTENEDTWPDPDNYWTNTHAWNLSLGLTWGFW